MGDRPTKTERRRERALARATSARLERRRRALRTGLGGLSLAVVVVLAVVVLMGAGRTGPVGSDAAAVRVDGPPRDRPLRRGDPVPSFSAPGLFGGTVAWSDDAGRPAVLAVWASWCPHCQAELPVLDRVMRDFPGVGFVTVTTAIGAAPGPTPEEYLRQQDLDFPVAVDDARGTLGAALGIQAFPTLYFVGSDGRVVAEMEGEVDEATLRGMVSALG